MLPIPVHYMPKSMRTPEYHFLNLLLQRCKHTIIQDAINNSTRGRISYCVHNTEKKKKNYNLSAFAFAADFQDAIFIGLL